MAQEQQRGSVYDVITIKHEPVEHDPVETPEHEVEHVFLKKEALEWEISDGHNSAQDPLSIREEECSPEEDFFEYNSHNIEKTEDEEDQENEEDKEAVVDEAEEQEHKYELESMSCGSSAESLVVTAGLEDHIREDGCGSLDTEGDEAVGTSDTKQYTTELNGHSENVSGTSHPVYNCGLCKKTFPQLEDLKKHTDLKNGCFRYFCCVCNRTYNNFYTRNNHIRLHSGGHQYTCAVCNMTFTEDKCLKNHCLLHTSKTPYKCGICARRFTRRRDITWHLSTHTVPFQKNCMQRNNKKTALQPTHSVQLQKNYMQRSNNMVPLQPTPSVYFIVFVNGTTF